MQIPFEIFPQNTPLVVGVSGGVDSMVLLYCLHEAQFPLHAVHINYQLRGSASELDEALVREFCLERQIPLSVERATYERGNLQNWARKYRYEAFQSIGAHIVLAHHADDQLETVLMNLLRGGGFEGAKGMLSVTQRGDAIFYRPLLKIRKSALYTFAQEKQIPFREDNSNQSNQYRRNALRNLIIPQIETHFGTAASTKILESVALIQQQNALLQELITTYTQKTTVYQSNQITILENPFSTYSISLQTEILRNIAAPYLPLNQERLARIMGLWKLGNGKKIKYDQIIFQKTRLGVVLILPEHP